MIDSLKVPKNIFLQSGKFAKMKDRFNQLFLLQVNKPRPDRHQIHLFLWKLREVAFLLLLSFFEFFTQKARTLAGRHRLFPLDAKRFGNQVPIDSKLDQNA